jgi:outer membrane protein OmpU
MKKLLLASTALVAFGAVSAQAAEPIKLTLGGYAVEDVGYGQNKELNASSTPAGTKVVNVDQQGAIELDLKGSTKLDSGISAAVEVDLNGSQQDDSRNITGTCGGTAAVGTAACRGNSAIKRAFVSVSGNFGAVILGEREDVGYIVHNTAPDVGTLGLGDGRWYYYVNSPSNHRFYSADNTSRYDARTGKFTYVTPSFQGVAAAFTYVPSVNVGLSNNPGMPTSSDSATYVANGKVNGTAFAGDLYVGGLAINEDFGDVKLKGDFGVGQANIANLRVYQGGLNVSFAGVTLGGSILNRHIDKDSSANGIQGNNFAQVAGYAGQNWTAGAKYENGPYGVSIGYFHDNSKANRNAAAFTTDNGGDSTSALLFSGSYALGPGVAFKGTLGYVSYDGNYSQAQQATAYLYKNSGVLAVTGIRLDF